uniref:Homeobox domain-containing protein n=1 Tax=Plectus sambesii TaxID=2011161 RepID=A0A914VDW0_9BILA
MPSPPPPPPPRRYSDFSIDRILQSKEYTCCQLNSEAIQRSYFDLTGSKEGSKYCRVERKQRTTYQAQQTRLLERAFETQQYIVGSDREVLADQLGLTESQVRIWFQNRRSKWRKELRAKNVAA